MLEALELSKAGTGSPRLSSSGSLAAGDSGDYTGEFLSEGSPIREETVSAYAIPVRSPGRPPAEGHVISTLALPESGTQLAVMNVSAYTEVGAGPSGPLQTTITQKTGIKQDAGGIQVADLASLKGSSEKPFVIPSFDDRTAVTAECSPGLVYEEFSQESAQDIVDSREWIVLSRACNDANTAVHTSGEFDGAAGSSAPNFTVLSDLRDESDLSDDGRKGETKSRERDGVSPVVTKSDLDRENLEDESSASKQVVEGKGVERAEGGHSAVECGSGYHVSEGEALYEGELVQGHQDSVQVDPKEPLYEGEAALCEQALVEGSSDNSVLGTVTSFSDVVGNLEEGSPMGPRREGKLAMSECLLRSLSCVLYCGQSCESLEAAANSS